MTYIFIVMHLDESKKQRLISYISLQLYKFFRSMG